MLRHPPFQYTFRWRKKKHFVFLSSKYDIIPEPQNPEPISAESACGMRYLKAIIDVILLANADTVYYPYHLFICGVTNYNEVDL